MNEQSLTPHLFDRYLHLLGIPRRAPSRDALFELVRAQLIRVPFENISKLYYRNRLNMRELPGLELFLDGIEKYNFGGTCYPNNYYLHLLLSHLGYDVSLCGAGMANPDVHLVNLVRVDGREYLVDGGYAAPFLEPIPRDLDDDHTINWGRDRYVLKPQDGKGKSHLELYRDGELIHRYTVNPVHRPIEHFREVIAHSFTGEATFMNALLLVRFFREHSIAIHNYTLIESAGTKSEITTLDGRDRLIRAIEEHFGIPGSIATQAIADLQDFGDAWN